MDINIRPKLRAREDASLTPVWGARWQVTCGKILGLGATLDEAIADYRKNFRTQHAADKIFYYSDGKEAAHFAAADGSWKMYMDGGLELLGDALQDELRENINTVYSLDNLEKLLSERLLRKTGPLHDAINRVFGK